MRFLGLLVVVLGLLVVVLDLLIVILGHGLLLVVVLSHCLFHGVDEVVNEVPSPSFKVRSSKIINSPLSRNKQCF